MAETFNYFNYYTEIEEYFWQKRGGALLVSTLDWAVIESWQKAGISLEVVLKGIDRAFEKYDARQRGRPIKSLLYCVDAVADAAEQAREAAAGRGPASDAPARPAAFNHEELARFFRRNAAALRTAAAASKEKKKKAGLADTLTEVAGELERLTPPLAGPTAGLAGLAEPPSPRETANLEDLERHLTVLEEKLQAAMTQAIATDELVEVRREVDRGLAPYRRKMKVEQLALIENQCLQKKLFEHFGLPRLSLFYLPVAPPSGTPEGE